MPALYGSLVKTRREKADSGGMISVPLLLRCAFVVMALCIADARANRVLSITSNEEQVTLTNEATQKHWQLNEPVCLVRGDKELACGFIGVLGEKQMTMQIESREFKVLPGMAVQVKRQGRGVSSSGGGLTRAEAIATGRYRPTADIALGPMAGLNYLFPLVPSVQLALTRKLTIGADIRYSTFCSAGVTGGSCLGFMATVNYYYSQFAFKGIYFSGGAGLYSTTLESGAVKEKVSPLALQGLVGWRGRPRWGMNFDVSLAAGAQYLMVDDASFSLRNEFRGLLPLVSMSLGYSF